MSGIVTETKSDANQTVTNKDGKYLTFVIGAEEYGLEILKVREIIGYMPITAVPQTPHYVKGVINLRGQVVTALDLRRQLDLPERAVPALPTNVIIRDGDEVVSFLVDKINDVVDVDEASFEPCPDTLLGVKRDLICGVYKLEDRLLLVLNAKQIMTFTTDPATLGSANAERGQPSIPG